MNYKICSVSDIPISKTEHINHILRRVKLKRDRFKPITINNEVLILPPGGLVLPYFKGLRGRWKIVLVVQYRAAIGKLTLEAPGGRLDSELVGVALGRELFEETGINIDPLSIAIVAYEYIQPSIINAPIYGGVVKINRKMIPNKNITGKKDENEYTQIEVFDLIEFLKKRDFGLITIDIMTSRLIDEVAKKVGLLYKKY